jgi:hypothetical protein
LEIAVATICVVGLFDAACLPFGWQSALQFSGFALLGALLWVADATLGTDKSSVKTSQRRTGSDVGHQIKM